MIQSIAGGTLNLQSEIAFFRDLSAGDQARLMAMMVHEMALEARTTYGQLPDQVQDGARLRFGDARTQFVLPESLIKRLAG